jgi:membrane protease YdiL (CAAX protease family)
MTVASFPARLNANSRTALRHPAARLLAFLYVAAALAFVAVTGDWVTLLIQLGLTFWTLLSALVLVSLTTQPPLAWQTAPHAPRFRLWLQLAVVLLAIAYTLFRGQALRSPELEALPLLGPLTARINDLDFELGNPLLYVVVPLVPLLLLGARPAELGLALPRSRADWTRTGLVILVMAFLNLAYIVPALIFGNFTLNTFGRRLLSNLLQNGFSEEFLMRGALMTRLVRLSDSTWGLVLSSLVFGLWHYNANLPMFAGSGLAALTFSLISQGIAGVGYALAFQRGGNLVAPSAQHALSHFFPF